ncbi:hypothetical protein IFM89_015089 [Coptis chinensis]|uniref:Vitamin K epoxide reductase domain-containing protein n=1 Tax=Coptis chinensis TaxID=261450 RepID=A0A835ISI3_9MAGN|nr:hypothetical protein IFM89_015089 [Coptis chinensis]
MVAALASFICISASQSHSRNRHFSAPPTSTNHFKVSIQRMVVVPVKCLQGQGPPQHTKEPEKVESVPPLSDSGISIYNWSTGLGALGLLETGYLTYLKLTGTEAFCPVSGGSCTDVLNSDYAVVFGVPLPLIGMVAYGIVTSLGLLLAKKSVPSGLGEDSGRLILLGTTTSMAAASAYFLYLLSTKFSGVSCSYCYASAALSFTLLFTTLKDLGWQQIQNVVGLQLFTAGLVVAALNTSYSTSEHVLTRLDFAYQPFYESQIATESSPLALSLAKHLHSVGAKMYGAFWCTHCQEQKQMFGEEAAKMLDYVECFPDGIRKGTKMAKACSDAGLEGFPTWVINGKVRNSISPTFSLKCPYV